MKESFLSGLADKTDTLWEAFHETIWVRVIESQQFSRVARQNVGRPRRTTNMPPKSRPKFSPILRPDFHPSHNKLLPQSHSRECQAEIMGRDWGPGQGGVKPPKIRGGVKILNFQGPLKLTPFYRTSKENCQFGGQKSKSSRGNFRGELPPPLAFGTFWPPSLRRQSLLRDI